ncbi:peptidyl-tRNA hydrolase [Calocera cornea HHB12733]|uniref:Peptidyl-tRNA hydrolase n=1 Tax=Calocera cornea HHB12733 TaxID=1353952 RepID=A0A165CPV7_9BASI|nr:peptidyl-tRNA hydrolase [Calocera cornea HHB12733]
MSAAKALPSAYLIAGIGNRTMPYTRHSAGLLMVNALAQSFGLNLKPVRGLNCICAETTTRILAGTKHEQSMRFIFANSEAFMNLSGRPVLLASQHYLGQARDPRSLIVVHDSIDLPPLTIKPKQGGSTNGHNGIESVKSALGTPDFWRIRLGVGEYDRSSGKKEMVNFVLGDLTGQERRFFGQPGPGVDEVWKAIEGIVEQNIKGGGSSSGKHKSKAKGGRGDT